MKESIRLSFPIFFGQLGFSLMGFADNMLAGRLGALSLSAFSLSSSIMFLAYALFVGFVLMFTPLIAQSGVERKAIFANGILVYLVLGSLLFFLLWLLGKHIFLFGQATEVVKIAKPYFEMLIISFIPTFLFQILKQFSDGLRKTRIPMALIIFSLIINIILDYGLMIGKFGMPRLGLIGAALGTLISRSILFAAMLLYLIRNKETKEYFSGLFNFKADFRLIKIIMSQVFFSSIQVFSKIILLVSTVILSGTLGPQIQASNQIFMNISSLMFTVSFSLAAAAAIKSSILACEKDSYSSLRSARIFLRLSIYSSLFFAFLLFFFAESIPLIYIKEEAVVRLVSRSLFLLALFQLCSGAETILLGVLKGLMDTQVPLYLAGGAYFIAVAVSYCLVRKIGFNGIWIGAICGVCLSFLLLMWRMFFIYEKFEIMREQKQP